jgi:eukaryotic-like serine/threonine-protein kinase
MSGRSGGTGTPPRSPATELFAGRYRLEAILGQGGMSDVYEALDVRNDQRVAVKIVRFDDPALAQRLAQEARALGRVEHPGLVRMLDSGVSGTQAYLAMELIEGTTLAASMQGVPFGAPRTAALGAELAEALAHVHDQGIVHRDVKPSNILLTPDGRAHLGDFGIARFLDTSTMTIAGTTVGTAAYMAPEQLENNLVEPSADIWSLGMVLLECLIGRRIYEGSASEVLARRLAGPVPLPADLPVSWKLLLSGMLDHRPDQRLTGAEAGALMRSSAFQSPWAPSPVSPDSTTSTQLDLTSLAASATSTETLGGQTTIVSPVVLAAHAPHRRPPARRGAFAGVRWRSPRVAAIAAVLVLGLVLGLVLSGGGPPSRGINDPSAPTTTAAPTTTTTVFRAPRALGTLVQDVATGVSSGTIDAPDGQNITNQAEQAITDIAAGNAAKAATDLQNASTVLVNGTQNGTITSGEAAVLGRDLTSLAAALGISVTTTQPPPPPGHGHGHGDGLGNGNVNN